MQSNKGISARIDEWWVALQNLIKCLHCCIKLCFILFSLKMQNKDCVLVQILEYHPKSLRVV